MSAVRAVAGRRGPTGERHSPGWYAAVSGLCLLMLVPMYLLVVNAFKDQRDIVSRPFSLDPSQFTLDHLVAAWNNPDFDIAWYSREHLGLEFPSHVALRHFLTIGEADGLSPAPPPEP